MCERAYIELSNTMMECYRFETEWDDER